MLTLDLAEALKIYQMACKQRMDRNEFSGAARLYKGACIVLLHPSSLAVRVTELNGSSCAEVGELEEELKNYKGAMAAWERAVDCYEAENAPS